MAGLKRFFRPGVVSLVGHVAALLVLLFTGARGFRSVPPEPITVEIVRSDEVPHIEGTSLDSTSNGSEISSNSKSGSANTGPPRPKLSEPPQQSQDRMSPQGGGKPAAAEPQAARPQPHPDETPKPNQHALSAGEMFAMPLVLPGGQISTGLDPAASNPAMLPHDDTAAFRARLGSCSHLPGWVGKDDKDAILLRVSFKPDGTLASPPELLRSSLTADAVALTNAAVDALQRCQPFTELPADKYKTWKTLDLVVTPLTLSGQ